MTETLDKVVAVNIYPIKSCQAAQVAGCQPDRLEVGPVGFEAYDVRDRDFVLAESEPSTSTERNFFVSQRGWNAEGKFVNRSDNCLATVELDIREDCLRISSSVGQLAVASAYDEKLPKRDVQIFNKLLPQAIDQGVDAADYFSTLLGRRVRLLRANRSEIRQLPEKYHRPGAANQVAAADGFPFLLTSQTSLDASHERNGLAYGIVPINRYRCNIVIDGSGLGPYGEDYVHKLKVGNMTAYLVKACARCPIPNIDQSSGERAGGGLKVLRGRTGYIESPNEKGVFFGQNLNHIYGPEQVVGVDNPVVVLEKADKPNIYIS